MSVKPFSKTNTSKDKSLNFEKKNLPNGKPNANYVDLLNEDPIIPSQMYGCYSFVSPEKIIKQKDEFMFQQFVNQWDFTKSLMIYSDFLSFLSAKYTLSIDSLIEDFKEFVKEEENVL